MSGRLQRLRNMSARELSFRARAVLRTQAERLHVALAAPRWTRRHIERILTPRVVDAPLHATLGAAEWQEAGRLLRAGLLRRANRFAIDPRDARGLTRAIDERWPDARDSAARAGDAILAGRHQVLGYAPLSFASETAAIDWHRDPVHQRRAPVRFWADVPYLDPACGDHKIIWEINRHQYFHALGRAYWLTGDRRYAAHIVHDIQDWLAANPPLVGINWASMLELGLRSLSWIAAIHFLLGDVSAQARETNATPAIDDAWLLDVLMGVDRQLTQVERHLSSYFSPNTHLTGEALALYVAGVALPELAASERWARTGKSILLAEIATQIHPDGGHAELSTCYHRYTLDFYTLAAITAELEGDTASAERFRDTVGRLRDYMATFADTHGRIPVIGDDDGGKLWGWTDRDPCDVRDSLALATVVAAATESAKDVVPGAADVPEETLWLAWSIRPSLRQQPSPSTRHDGRGETSLRVHHLPDSGYVVAHTRSGDRLTFDVGPHGFRNGGHAHADALAITLNLGGTPFLVDAGTATYTMDPELRNRLRDTAAHNTLTVDARPSAVPRGAFQWATRANAQLHSLRRNSQLLVAEGTHDGYTPAVHRRTVVHSPDTGWLIVDTVDGVTAPVDLHWHFDPQWLVESATSHALLATGPTGFRTWLLHAAGTASLVRGDGTDGWCSPRYGALVPTFTARIRYETNDLPLATWIGSADEAAAPRIIAVPVRSGTRGAAYRVIHRHGTTLTLVHPGAATPPVTICDDVTSDARAVQLTTRRSGGLGIALADGQQLATPALHVTEVICSEPVEDLYIGLQDEVAELWTTTPPGNLHLRFAEGRRPRRLRLNGRDTVGLSRGEQMDIPASFWSAPPPEVARATPSDPHRFLHVDAERLAEGAHTVISEGHP
jgi:hypothetical protein